MKKRKNCETVCAVIVTYNRKLLLLECLEALSKQTRPIQGIYLIDNASTDGTPELLVRKGYIKEGPPENLSKPWEKIFEIKNLTDEQLIKLHYVRMHENTGGAGGFHEGVKRAYKRGYDWLWLMDDDAEPKDDCLKKLNKYFTKEQVVALTPAVIGIDNQIDYSHRGSFNFELFPQLNIPVKEEYYNREFLEIEFSSFVGLLIKARIIKDIGFPKKEFFIHHDDIEYCIRLNKKGKIFLIPYSTIYHKYHQKKFLLKKTFLWKNSLRYPYNVLWMRYYALRNATWISIRESTNKFKIFIRIFFTLLKEIVRILIYDDFKFKRSLFLLNAFYDGFIGRFDNIKPKKILYTV